MTPIALLKYLFQAPANRTVVLRLRAPFGTLFESLSDPLQAAIRGVGRYTAIDARARRRYSSGSEARNEAASSTESPAGT